MFNVVPCAHAGLKGVRDDATQAVHDFVMFLLRVSRMLYHMTKIINGKCSKEKKHCCERDALHLTQ